MRVIWQNSDVNSGEKLGSADGLHAENSILESHALMGGHTQPLCCQQKAVWRRLAIRVVLQEEYSQVEFSRA